MIRALYSSASGLQAQQNNLDVIANNLANVNTTGFKKSKIEFQDLLYQATRMAGSEQGAGNALPAASREFLGLNDYWFRHKTGVRARVREIGIALSQLV